MKIKKRVLSICLVLSMIIGILPTVSFALDESSPTQVWDGSTATSFAGGTGTEDDPYQIATGEQLDYLRYLTNEIGGASSSIPQLQGYNSKHYILVADIYLNDVENVDEWKNTAPENEWTAIGGGTTLDSLNKNAFYGTFDGNGYTIYGIYTNSSASFTGLFGIINNATIKNVNVAKSYIAGNTDVGGIVGAACWEATITNCKNTGTVCGTTKVGGIVGSIATGSLCEYCANMGEVSGDNAIGGIAGANTAGNASSTIISCCYNTGNISGTSTVAGIVGDVYNEGSGYSYVNDCYNTGEVTCTGSKVGGIVAQLSPTRIVNRCYNVGNIITPESNTFAGAIIGCRELRSVVNKCYYLESTCVRGSNSSWFGEEKLSPLTDSQMQLQSSFEGFDFDSVWYIAHNSTYPKLIFPETILYAKILVVDSTTNQPISDFSINMEISNDLAYAVLDDGQVYIKGIASGFASSIPVYISKEGYENFLCHSDKLQKTPSLTDSSDNIVYLVPNGVTDIENEAENLYILEHIQFAKDKYPSFVNSYGFNNAYWQFDDGSSLVLSYAASFIGDVSDTLSFKFGDLEITANYYDVFLADLIIAMSDTEHSTIVDTTAFQIYSKYYSKVVDNWVQKFMQLDSEKEDLFSKAERDAWNSIISDIQNASTDTGKVGWDAVVYDIEQLLKGDGKEFEINSTTEKLLNFVFTPEFLSDHKYIIDDVFEGFSVANEVCEYVNDASDSINCFLQTTRAYITVGTSLEMQEHLFDLLTKAADEMDVMKALYFKNALNKYQAIASSKVALYCQCYKELSKDVLQFTYNSFVRGYLKKAGYTEVANVLGCPLVEIQAVTLAYNLGYAIGDSITKLSDKAEQYHFMYYLAPLEAALEMVVEEYGDTLLDNQTYENAKIYDYAYRTLAATNKYLYNCLYTLGASGVSINLGNTHIGQVSQLMELATIPINAWTVTKCHGNALSLTNRYQYTSIQCPVDVYVYDSEENLLVSIVDEEVIDYDPSILVLNYNGKKTLVYPADKDYVIKIVSRDEGIMDYYVAEIADTGTRNIDFYNIPLAPRKTYTGRIPSEFDVDSGEYTLYADEDTQTADYDSNNNETCLPSPFDLKWEGTKALWNKVENATSYVVYLYKDGENVVSAVTEETIYDFSDAIDEVGNYTFAVVAVGNEISIFNSRRSSFSESFEYFPIIHVNNIQLNLNVCHIATGDSFELISIITPDNATNQSIVWNSSDNKVATVNENGLVTAVGEGTATITATTADGGFTATCKVTVSASTLPIPQNHTVTFDPNGGTVTPVSAITGEDGTLVSLPVPTRDGYTFNDWYSAPSGGDKITTNTVFTTDTTVYAQWSKDTSGSSSSGSGSSTASTYTIFTSATENGSVSVSLKSARAGTTVTITATPDTGYQLEKLLVTDKNGNSIKLTDQGNGKYTFTMPASKVSVAASFIALEVPAPSLPFTDVTASDWFYDAVTYVYDNGLMTGTSANAFSPNATTTRGMIVTILHRLEGTPTADASGFTDVEKGAWYQDAVDWAAANGIVNGTSQTTFAPNAPITREQMAAILYRYAAYKGYDVSQKAQLDQFQDQSAVSGYAEDALAWANAAGLITGVTDTTLSPKGSAVRAQTATILMRFCESVVK